LVLECRSILLAISALKGLKRPLVPRKLSRLVGVAKFIGCSADVRPSAVTIYSASGLFTMFALNACRLILRPYRIHAILTIATDHPGVSFGRTVQNHG